MARRLTLTFDNGPDPELTPHVLDTLAFDAVAAGAIIFHAVTGLDSHAIGAVATQVRRVASAAGEGSVAVPGIYEFLSDPSRHWDPLHLVLSSSTNFSEVG